MEKVVGTSDAKRNFEIRSAPCVDDERRYYALKGENHEPDHCLELSRI
jgi:hypothetical protein